MSNSNKRTADAILDKAEHQRLEVMTALQEIRALTDISQERLADAGSDESLYIIFTILERTANGAITELEEMERLFLDATHLKGGN